MASIFFDKFVKCFFSSTFTPSFNSSSAHFFTCIKVALSSSFLFKLYIMSAFLSFICGFNLFFFKNVANFAPCSIVKAERTVCGVDGGFGPNFGGGFGTVAPESSFCKSSVGTAPDILYIIIYIKIFIY